MRISRCPKGPLIREPAISPKVAAAVQIAVSYTHLDVYKRQFLHHVSSELWGHRRTAKPGNEKTGASEVGVWLANPPGNPKT